MKHSKKGHRRIMMALSDHQPRHAPASGWTLQCLCGWKCSKIFSTRLPAHKAYAEHIDGLLLRCTKCGEPKQKAEMSRSAGKSQCKACVKVTRNAWKALHPKEWDRLARKHHLLSHYGITEEQFNELLAKQTGKCAICGENPFDKRV